MRKMKFDITILDPQYNHHTEQLDIKLKIYLKGSLTFLDFHKFKSLLKAGTNLIQGTSPTVRTIDMSEVDYIDAAGLGMFIYVLQMFKLDRMKISVEGLQGQPKKMIELSKLIMET